MYAPLLRFVGNKFCEVSGRTTDHATANIGEPRLRAGLCEGCVDFLVELADDFGRSVPGSVKADPVTRLIVRYEFTHSWYLGQRIRPCIPVVASARSLPARTCATAIAMGEKKTSTWPPSRLTITGPATAIRNMRHLDAGHILKQLTG